MAEARTCTECGQGVSERARFCERCGAALTPGAYAVRAPEPLAEKIERQRSAIEGERKQVTVMFVDIVGSMELSGRMDAERWTSLLDRFLPISTRPVHELEGTVHQFTGDGLMAIFGAPLAHEDHARRACLAALRIQDGVRKFAEELEESDGIPFSIRCGLNSGEVIVGSIGDDLHMEYTPIGTNTGLSKRMESLAPSGSTAISASTAALVEGEFELRELGSFEVKGMSEPQRVLELVGPGAAHSRLEAAAARGLSPFVGRDSEWARLESALDSAVAGDGRIVLVVGEPGVGKSRLCREFVDDCRDRGLTINSGSGVAHGRAVPLLPVLAMLRDFFGVNEGDSPEEVRGRIESALIDLEPAFEADLPLVFDFLGVPDPERPLERIDLEARQRRLLAFIGHLVEARSGREPGVIVVEDLHWVDEASAVFMEALAEAVEGTRTLLVATFRPEYDAAWTRSPSSERLALSPLDDEAAGRLLEELLGEDPSLDGLSELIRERTAGNPFFIEEVARALAETGNLAGERGAYTLAGPLDALVLPPTVQAVLAARIDRLPSRDKSVVQTMSVIGREVPEPVLNAVADLEPPELRESVAALEAAEFLTESRSDGQRELTFKHPLTQEVAYSSQLSERRARTHARVAEAIERLHPDGLEERAGLLAHHSEAAGDERKAAEWHARAAVWVSASSPPDGMRHWRRVRDLTDALDGEPEAAGLGIAARIGILSHAWRVAMPHDEAAAIHLEGLERLSDSQPFERVLLDMAYAVTLSVGGRELEGQEFARASADRAFELGDPGLILNVAWPAAFQLWELGPVPEGFELVDRALELAGDEVLAGAGLIMACPYAACLWVRGLDGGTMGRFDQAWADFERSIELAREHRDLETEAYALATRSVLRADAFFWARVLDDAQPALADAERAVEVAERSGSVDGLASASTVLAFARVYAGRFGDAIEPAARSLEMAHDRQVALQLESTMLTALAAARMGCGQPEEAREAAHEAVEIIEARSLKRIGIHSYFTLAEVILATEGMAAAAAVEETLSRALERARETGALLTEPKLRIELAALARLRDDEAAARSQETEAKRGLESIAAPHHSFDTLTEDTLLARASRVGSSAARA